MAVTAKLNKVGTATKVAATCLNIGGINATGTAIPVFFSTNGGSNTNITFQTTPAVTSAFAPDSLLSSFCYGDTVYFNNSSLPYNGTINDLTFEWSVNDGSLPILESASAFEGKKINYQLNYPQPAGISYNFV